MDVALVTCLNPPKFDTDDEPLRAALRAAGVEAAAVPWESEDFDWHTPRMCIVRSTWNYVQQHQAFLSWVDRCGALTALWNPPSTIRWNSHKGYLLELAQRGVPVLPTQLIRRGGAANLEKLIEVWPAVVIKPAVSAGSFATMLVDKTNLSAGQAHLTSLLAARDMLVQQYAPSVMDHGERALVWIDGEFTHAVRKNRRLAGDKEQVSQAVPIASDEAALAGQVVDLAPRPLLYARIDVVRDDEGAVRLMELELIEPSLFLTRSPAALARFANAIAARIPSQLT